MKKSAFLVGLVLLVLQSEAVTINGWTEHRHKFSSETDLIRGQVLLSSGILKPQRFYGNINYYYEEGERINGLTCSFWDRGNDPMADLLVLLFPSSGPDLNAQGTGTIAFIQEKQTDFIAGMFKIAAEARGGEIESSLFMEINRITSLEHSDERRKLIKNFVKHYFNLKKGSKLYYSKLFRLGKSVAEAVKLEREEGNESLYKEEKPYPPFYTNDLICAYVWSIFPDEKLDELARKLGYTEGEEKYRSKLFERIVEDIDKYPSVVPFYAGQHVITNSNTEYNGRKFADCVETTLRQLFCCVFCESVNEDGKYTDQLELNLHRIPENSKALKEFFAPEGKPRDIRKLANDGSLETRKEWAGVVSGYTCVDNKGSPIISYAKTECELIGGWNNMIKMFCLLMDGYSASQNGLNTDRNQKAEASIKTINQLAKEGSFSINESNILEIINDLLGIRTDIELIAERGVKLKNVNIEEGDVEVADIEEIYIDGTDEETAEGETDVKGWVSIYPNLNGYDEDTKKYNKLNFFSQRAHAYLESIPRRRNFCFAKTSNSWIERLYNDREIAIIGEVYDFLSYEGKNLSRSNYPLLDFYLRIGGDFRIDWMHFVAADIMSSSTPHIEAIARWVFGQNNNIYSILYADDIPLENLKELCSLVIKHSNDWGDIEWAIEFLKDKDPDELFKIFLKKDESGNLLNELSVKITEATPIRDLIILRITTKLHDEIDPYIEKFIENAETIREVLDVFAKIYGFVDGIMNTGQVPPFKKSMLKAFVPHIKKELELKQNGKNIAYSNERNILRAIDLIDFDEVDPTVQEFIQQVKGKRYNSHFFQLKNDIARSQAKLEMLLPISYTSRSLIADRILNDFKGHFSPEQAASIVLAVSKKNIPTLISKIKERNKIINDQKLHLTIFDIKTLLTTPDLPQKVIYCTEFERRARWRKLYVIISSIFKQRFGNLSPIFYKDEIYNVGKLLYQMFGSWLPENVRDDGNQVCVINLDENNV